jgi:MbtH protein
MNATQCEIKPTENTETHIVVMNHEEQYSIWPVGKALPTGWSSAGFRGSETACLEHIGVIWTDMRPRSLR